MFRWVVLLSVTVSFSAAALASSTEERPFGHNFPLVSPWVATPASLGTPVYRGQCTKPESAYFCAFQALKYG